MPEDVSAGSSSVSAELVEDRRAIEISSFLSVQVRNVLLTRSPLFDEFEFLRLPRTVLLLSYCGEPTSWFEFGWSSPSLG